MYLINRVMIDDTKSEELSRINIQKFGAYHNRWQQYATQKSQNRLDPIQQATTLQEWQRMTRMTASLD